MSWLTTSSSFELTGMGAAPGFSELQAFLSVFFANDDQSNIHFSMYISQKIAPHPSF